MAIQRESNFELLRIIAIILVLLLHANFFALEGPSASEIIDSSIDATLRIIFQSMSIVAVNVFVMISGWFGIKPSKIGFLNLIFQVFFYLLILYGIGVLSGTVPISFDGFKNLILLTSSNWFIKAYILLYIFAPVLNHYVERAGRSEFRMLIIAFFIFQTLYGWAFPRATDYIEGGYSPISFMGLYLLVRYVRLYSPKWAIRYSATGAILMFFTVISCVTVACVSPPLLNHEFDVIYGYNFLNYVSPTTILASLLLVMAFSKISLNSKMVNRLAASSFAVYLVYVSPWSLSLYGDAFFQLHQRFQGFAYWGITIVVILALYAAVACVDMVRIHIWTKLCKRLVY